MMIEALGAVTCAETPELQTLSGGGYRDTSRIAAGPAPMWAEIFLGNRDELISSLDAMQNELTEIRQLIERQDTAALTAYLEKARQIRKQLR